MCVFSFRLTPPAGAEKPERSGGFLVPLAGLVIALNFNSHQRAQHQVICNQ